MPDTAKDDLLLLQIRLFCLAQQRWNASVEKCTQIFKQYHLYEYIETAYEDFHVQGDDASLDELTDYVQQKGEALQ